ncbi:MAG: hypothetical protein WC350_04860 [Candidatus Micrarchaeia archaeon]
MKYELQDIKEKVNRAIWLLLKNDLLLFKYEVGEWSISHKLAEYLQSEFPEWHVDCEYNRDMALVKKFGFTNIRPDIIIHLRGTSENLLVIEIKTAKNPDHEGGDGERIKGMTDMAGRFRYKFGAFIFFDIDADKYNYPKPSFYENGREA